MYLSLNWVKNWLKLPKDISAKQLALDLTMSTVEVEEVIDQAAMLDKVVVGKIKEITKHPNADRLQVCQVDIGESTSKLVCGGSNLTKGMLVAVAQIGSQVRWHGEGELVTLEKAKIRGVESNGMIAASTEIGLGDLFPIKAENEILDLTGFKVRPGEPLSEALSLNDIIIDIDNKSINHRPDLWGQYGLARELAAIYKIKLKEYTVADLAPKSKGKLKVSVADKDNCFRYLGLVIKGIKVAESPLWLKSQLQAVGIRPINNIVDVTNYIMYELGQPLHAFDSRQIANNHIEVKQAQKGEVFVTLDGEKRKLPEGALMIADSDKYVALAGIMGGQNSEISQDSSDIIIESANFRDSSVRRTSMALGLRSESSARFEKSLDPVIAEVAIKKASQMILELCPEATVASQLVDVDNNPFKAVSLQVPEALINQRFGVTIPTADIKDILKRLQFTVAYKAKTFSIKVPSFRATKDISIPEDIVEEVARIYGYDNIQAQLPIVTLQKPRTNIEYQAGRDIKKWLALSQMYNELYTYPFSNLDWAKKLNLDIGQHVKVKNAVSPEQTYLNMSLLPNLLKKAEENMRWYEEFRIFELERVFDKSSKGIYQVDAAKDKFLPKQDKMLAGVEVGKQSQEQLFLSIKGLVGSMMKYWGIDWSADNISVSYAKAAYQINFQENILGQFGVLDTELFDSGGAKVNIGFWQIDFTLLIKYISQVPKFRQLSKYPSINRDLAVVVDKSLNWQQIKDEVLKISPLIQNIEPFDVFVGQSIGDNKKSIAFHLEFRSDDRTLLAEDIDKIMENIAEILQKKFQAVRR
jgi:phenylalanyl-tRNA synthetase beta chain